MMLLPITSPRLVIIDHFDAPQTQMVAVIGRQIEPGTHEWRYVAERSAGFPARGGLNCGSIAKAMPVAKFGVRLLLEERPDGLWLDAKVIHETRVLRDNKSPREWADIANITHPVRIHADLAPGLLRMATRTAANDTNPSKERKVA